MAADVYNWQAPSISVDRFSHLLGMIYESALDTAKWVRCFEEVCNEFSANYVSLIVQQSVPTKEEGLIFSGSDDRRLIQQHNPHLSLSPFRGLPLDKLVTIGDMLSEAEWRSTTYYQAWCAPHEVFHVMAVDFATADRSVYGFRLTRPESAPPFSSEDRALCERLVPHLKRALNLYQSTHQDRRITSLYSQAMVQLMVGVIVLDEHGMVIETNAIAKAMLQSGDGLKLIGNHVTASYAMDNRKLQSLVAEALRAPSRVGLIEAMAVSRPSGQASWGVVVRQLATDEWTDGKHRPAVAIFVRDPEGASHPPVKLAQQLFELTPAETALAIQLTNGLSLEEAAEALGIRRNTARAHLRSIFSKTGVRRQTELVRIFLNSVMLLGTSEVAELAPAR
ncbi:helix-turn-helix transcriptional regulator [Paraburkholderia unamae]|uniref:DNA-binding CsgD family transcriptional regulator n=1 Tax=Paraburkholderia unamae TaxID=219649 RepID=A0ABX5KIA5_9BURK|nr:helix-turn-helix transcriptional regulator [Paraburkholderia unamae]PVX81166.1 DNA-binding CsgD family transcriptional regulator [Paraburkholderia unamae]RAR53351.1 DNA-binding CsgD family transcriptional regulator [Paraburkholderia unamae]CAG9261615.1 Helix-turn-helix transcriptional regulator [Paraburkholderia unamae]